jgi:hypothetical protein
MPSSFELKGIYINWYAVKFRRVRKIAEGNY